jgi:DNA-binding transcriptional MerR regulator
VAEYRIDDIARLAGIASRNIREYQEKGLLPYPRREGRVAWYTEEHLTRARLVAQLVARGHSLAGVRQLIETWEKGGDLEDIIPAEATMTRPWTDELPERTTLEDLRHSFGEWVTPATVKRAVALGLIEPDGDGFRVPSPRIIRAGEQLVGLGVSLPEVFDIAEAMQHDADVIAARFVTPVRARIVPQGRAPNAKEIPEIADTIEKLRPLAFTATEAFLAQAMQRALAGVFDEVVAGSQDQPDRTDAP